MGSASEHCVADDLCVPATGLSAINLYVLVMRSSIAELIREGSRLFRNAPARRIGSTPFAASAESAAGAGAKGAAAEGAGAAGAGEASGSGAADASTRSSNPVVRAFGYAADTMFYSMLGATVWGVWYSYQYSLGEVESQVNDLRLKAQLDSGSVAARAQLPWMSSYLNFRRFCEEKMNYYAAPMQPKLLPDVEQAYGPYIGPQIRTLVLDLVGVLVHAEWSRDRGWRYFKRPGVDDLLKQANELGWEVVVYTPSPASLAEPIIKKIDPTDQLIAARLYRDHTQYVSDGIIGGGKHVCDLSKLNRNPARTLFVGADPSTWSLQPDNAVKLKKWDGSSGDTTLLDLIPFLEMIKKLNAPDTRQIVRSFEGKDFLEEFKERAKSLKKGGDKPAIAPSGIRLFGGGAR